MKTAEYNFIVSGIPKEGSPPFVPAKPSLGTTRKIVRACFSVVWLLSVSVPEIKAGSGG